MITRSRSGSSPSRSHQHDVVGTIEMIEQPVMLRRQSSIDRRPCSPYELLPNDLFHVIAGCMSYRDTFARLNALSRSIRAMSLRLKLGANDTLDVKCCTSADGPCYPHIPPAVISQVHSMVVQVSYQQDVVVPQHVINNVKRAVNGNTLRKLVIDEPANNTFVMSSIVLQALAANGSSSLEQLDMYAPAALLYDNFNPLIALIKCTALTSLCMIAKFSPVSWVSGFSDSSRDLLHVLDMIVVAEGEVHVHAYQLSLLVKEQSFTAHQKQQQLKLDIAAAGWKRPFDASS